MRKIRDLKFGDVLSNDELKSIFQCSSRGGMRRSKATSTLVLVSARVKSIYIDRWDNNILYYTGMGTEGDQSFNFAQNKTLYHSSSNNVSVYLFEVYTNREYTFIGQVILDKEPFFEIQSDANNKDRRVCIFPVKVIVENKILIDKNILSGINEIRKIKIKKIDNNYLLLLARKGTKIPSNRLVVSKQYERNEAVAEYAKRLAKGFCLLCGKEAPFTSKDGEPYLETPPSSLVV